MNAHIHVSKWGFSFSKETHLSWTLSPSSSRSQHFHLSKQETLYFEDMWLAFFERLVYHHWRELSLVITSIPKKFSPSIIGLCYPSTNFWSQTFQILSTSSFQHNFFPCKSSFLYSKNICSYLSSLVIPPILN